MPARPRLLSAGYAFALTAIAVIVEAAVQAVTGIPLVGGLVAAAIGAGIGIIWRSPAEAAAKERAAEADRRAAALEREIAAFNSPARLVEDAARLTRMRRMGPIGGSRDVDAR